MAKQSKSDSITPKVKETGKGVQANKQMSEDFGALEMWNEAHNPPSVKRMVGKRDEFARIKHDVDGRS